MPVSIQWDDKEVASLILSINGRLVTNQYQNVLGQLMEMAKERETVALIIHYGSDFSVHYDNFVDSAKQFYNLLNSLGIWHVVIATRNSSIIGLWEGTLALYKVEPPTYEFAQNIEDGLTLISVKRNA